MNTTEISSRENPLDKYSTEKSEKWRFINTICRLCSLECQLKSQNILQKKILEMLKFCSSLRPSELDGLPRRICSSCLQSLTNSYLFRIKMEATDILLKKKLEVLFVKKDILDISLNNAQIKSLHSETIVKEENTEDISENSSSVELDSTKIIQMTQKALVPNSKVEVIFDDSPNSNVDEGKKEPIVLKTLEACKKVINVALPPLIPIQTSNNNKTKALNQTSMEDPPPLVPLKSIVNEGMSSKLPSENINIEKEIISESSQKNRIEIIQSSKSLFCNICKKEFQEGEKLIRHLKGHMVPKNFSCTICGKKYPSPSTFQIHMRSHTGERPFKCPVCDKGFSRWAGVVSHLQSHEDNRPFKCDSCDQSFKVSSNLERHKVLHAGVLPFCCNYCGKTFSQSSNLQLHIRTYHTNERPYLCSVCGKGFVSSTRLNRHMRIHTGYKPFHCRICTKGYSNISDLKNHEFGVHGNKCEKPFSCDICDKKFFYSCRLTKHLKTHSSLHHVCNQCSKTFPTSNCLAQHIESKHPESNFTDSTE